MGSSKFSFLISLLILNGWLSLTAEGLKCHVCHSGMKSCNSSVSTKEYLVECPGSTLACATITVEAPLNTESWFLRICLYTSDLTCFGIDRKDLDANEGIVKKPSRLTLSMDIDCAKEERQKASLAELPGAPNSLRNKKGLTKPWMGIHTCQGSADGCNSWDQPVLFPYSVGYPAEENDNKMQPVSCYQCKVTDFKEPGAQGCIDLTQDVNSRNNEDIWERKKTLKTQGCKILSIYQPSPSGMEPYFERSHWFPGDYWCLTRKYKSGAESRIQVGYDEDEDVIDEGASDDALTCREGYMRALESKNEEDEELSYSWSGQKVFQTSEEFSQFIKCLEQVRRKVANVMARSNPVQIPFNETAENEKITGRGATDDDEPFAFVGFQICGPDDNCNDWSDEKLYGMMRNPPSRTPPAFSSTPSTSSTVTENSTAEVEVSSSSPAPAPPASIAPRRKKGKKVTSSAPKIEVEDEEGSAARPEIPDKGCKIKKNQAGRLTLSGWLLISSCMLIFH